MSTSDDRRWPPKLPRRLSAAHLMDRLVDLDADGIPYQLIPQDDGSVGVFVSFEPQSAR